MKNIAYYSLFAGKIAKLKKGFAVILAYCIYFLQKCEKNTAKFNQI